ncbi:hypothetical protein KL86SPO_20060 [uncultured Sporomusa sp.]|uniref:Uncharacterized protein n=1 Tax=uncultured Sporomusa sp. TaxID=307249 RepID=A0A212LLR9_9FIRM|nr:hypothetical protein KL86SPO_20057 [uncultured Sporomusa sp.]SCM78480.1 hypothetical protein KL86SPO_20060 [uncultured Sporomusa sp.]
MFSKVNQKVRVSPTELGSFFPTILIDGSKGTSDCAKMLISYGSKGTFILLLKSKCNKIKPIGLETEILSYQKNDLN